MTLEEEVQARMEEICNEPKLMDHEREEMRKLAKRELELAVRRRKERARTYQMKRKKYPEKAKKTRCFKVYITLPEGANEDAAMDYIENAVCNYAGALYVADPMFKLDRDSVSVKRQTAKYEP